jgi:hypothetical protein
MLSVGKLNVVMLSVVAPVQCLLFIALGAHQNKLECFFELSFKVQGMKPSHKGLFTCGSNFALG